MDYFTKWYEAYAIPDQEAETVTDTLSAMCKCLGIKKTHTTPLQRGLTGHWPSS